MDKQLRDLFLLLQLGEGELLAWEKEWKKQNSLQKRALKSGKEFEAKAHEICANMFWVNKELYKTIREKANAQYDKSILLTEKLLAFYKK